MNQSDRIFNNIFTVQYTIKAFNSINPSQRNYFTGFPNLYNIKVKALSVTNINPSITNAVLTLADRKKIIKLTNYPIIDLSITNNPRLKLFNIDGIDLTSSYWIIGGSGVGFGTDTLLFNLHFHY